jgi:hypothetical protein
MSREAGVTSSNLSFFSLGANCLKLIIIIIIIIIKTNDIQEKNAR